MQTIFTIATLPRNVLDTINKRQASSDLDSTHLSNRALKRQARALAQAQGGGGGGGSNRGGGAGKDHGSGAGKDRSAGGGGGGRTPTAPTA